MYASTAWLGVAAVILALLCTIWACFQKFTNEKPPSFGWGFFVLVSLLLIEFALLFGNIGVIVSNAGFTG